MLLACWPLLGELGRRIGILETLNGSPYFHKYVLLKSHHDVLRGPQTA